MTYPNQQANKRTPGNPQYAGGTASDVPMSYSPSPSRVPGVVSEPPDFPIDDIVGDDMTLPDSEAPWRASEPNTHVGFMQVVPGSTACVRCDWKCTPGQTYEQENAELNAHLDSEHPGWRSDQVSQYTPTNQLHKIWPWAYSESMKVKVEDGSGNLADRWSTTIYSDFGKGLMLGTGMAETLHESTEIACRYTISNLDPSVTNKSHSPLSKSEAEEVTYIEKSFLTQDDFLPCCVCGKEIVELEGSPFRAWRLERNGEVSEGTHWHYPKGARDPQSPNREYKPATALVVRAGITERLAHLFARELFDGEGDSRAYPPPSEEGTTPARNVHCLWRASVELGTSLETELKTALALKNLAQSGQQHALDRASVAEAKLAQLTKMMENEEKAVVAPIASRKRNRGEGKR